MVGFILGATIFALVGGWAIYEQIRRERQVRILRQRYGLTRRQASKYHEWLRRQAGWDAPQDSTEGAKLYIDRWMEEFVNRH